VFGNWECWRHVSLAVNFWLYQANSACSHLIVNLQVVRTCSSIPSQPQCCTKIVMLEGACHACDLCAPATDFLSDCLPCSADVRHLPDRGPSLFHWQTEKLRRIFKETNRTRSLVEIDVRRQDARLDSSSPSVQTRRPSRSACRRSARCMRRRPHVLGVESPIEPKTD
jgi:hypothetical protein